ncbi:hypothetical protein EG329_003967 [Mollisiaceae sp. DMI_Dod_QoI]|nr:hypothetical protein EG329_003967 [Helotiales sp. DMI_Dod_QoI]
MLSHVKALFFSSLILAIPVFASANEGPWTLQASSSNSTFDGWHAYVYFRFGGDTEGEFWLTNDTKTVPTKFTLSSSSGNLVAYTTGKNATEVFASIQPSLLSYDNDVWFFSQGELTVTDATLLECPVSSNYVGCQVTNANNTLLNTIYACPIRWHGQPRAQLKIGLWVPTGCSGVQLNFTNV